jgi:hypothetical protein
MVIGGHSPLLVVFCLDAWCVKKVIQLPEDVSGVRQIEFIPQLFDAGANKVSKRTYFIVKYCTRFYMVRWFLPPGFHVYFMRLHKKGGKE